MVAPNGSTTDRDRLRIAQDVLARLVEELERERDVLGIDVVDL